MGCCGGAKEWILESTWPKGVVGLTKSALKIDRAPDSEIQWRLDQCRICPDATRSSNPKFAANKGLTTRSRCRLCKCFVVPKAKILGEHCPAGKWERNTG